MSAFKPTQSRDGEFRATIREPLRVDLSYITIALIEAGVLGTERLTRHKIGQAVRQAVRNWGWELYSRVERQEDTYHPEDHNGMDFETYYKVMQQKVIEVYPEFKEQI